MFQLVLPANTQQKFNQGVLSLASSHYLVVRYPIVPSRLVAWCYSTSYFNKEDYGLYYVDLDGNVLKDTQYGYRRISLEAISQGSAFDRYGNKTVTHEFVTGTITYVPSNIKVLPVKNDSSSVSRVIVSYNGLNMFKTISRPRSLSNPTTYLTRTLSANSFVERIETAGKNIYQSLSNIRFLYNSRGVPFRVLYKMSSSGSPFGENTAGTELWDTVDNWNIANVTGLEVPSDKVIADLANHVRLVKPLPYQTSSDQDNHVLDSLYESLNIPSINNISNIKDVKDVKSQVLSLARQFKTLSRVKTIWNFAKPFASFYLMKKYSVDTTMMDINTRLDWINKSMDNMSKIYQRSVFTVTNTDGGINGSSTSTTYRYHILREQFHVSFLRTLGLDPNMLNIWDTIPFSFVVDWFIGIGDKLDTLDRRSIIQNELHILSSYTSEKTISYYSNNFGQCLIDLSYSRYQRSKLPSLPDYSGTSANSQFVKHAWDGAALIVALKRK